MTQMYMPIGPSYKPGNAFGSNPILVFDDFCNGPNVSITADATNWWLDLATASGAVTTIDSSESGGGAIQITCITADGTACLRSQGGPIVAYVGQRIYFETRIQSAFASGTNLGAGLVTSTAVDDVISANGADDYVKFRINSDGSIVLAHEGNNSGTESTTTLKAAGTYTANTWIVLGLEWVVGKSLRAFIDGTMEYQTHSQSNLPDAGTIMNLFVGADRNTNNTAIIIDYVGLLADRQ